MWNSGADLGNRGDDTVVSNAKNMNEIKKINGFVGS